MTDSSQGFLINQRGDMRLKPGGFMITRSSTSQALLLAGTIVILVVALAAFAQQEADKPSAQPAAPSASDASKSMPIQQPQPTTVPGRPDIPNAEVAKQLRNVAPLPFGAPEDKLPVAQLKVPKGFKVEVYASGIPNARSLRLGDKGTVFVSNRILDKVYAIVDRNGKPKSSPRDWTGPTVSPFTTVRSTSPRAPKFPSSKKSKITWTIRPSPWSSTATFSTISPMVGNSWPWGRTASFT